MWGVGGILGSQIPRRLPSSRLSTALAIGNGISGLGILGIGLARSLGVALGASAYVLALLLVARAHAQEALAVLRVVVAR